MFLELLIIISCIFWIILFINQQNKLLKIMQFFVFGMFIKSLFITFYTYLYYPELLLKRVLFDPFSMQECNSPAISLMAVYGFLFSIYSLFKKEQKAVFKFFNIVVILLGFFIAVLLQARSFFIITIVFFIYILIIQLKFKNLLKLIISTLIISFFLVLINSFMSKSDNSYTEILDKLFIRFQDEKTESNRYEQWSSAIEIISNNPFGGGSTNKKIEFTYWFHNLWLDIGRTSGVIPLFLMLLFQIRILLALKDILFIKHSLETHFLLIFYISLLIGLFVEIALEGNIVMFVFYIFFSSLILRYLQLEINKTKCQILVKNLITTK